MAVGSYSITNKKLARVPTNTIKGRVSIGVGDTEDLTPSQSKSIVGVEELFTIAEKEKLAGLSPFSGDCFSLVLGAYSFAPADATTYYFGSVYSRSPSTTPGISRIYVPRVGTSYIRAAHIMFNNWSTAGTAEPSSIYIRVNDTDDYLISNSLMTNSAVNHVSNSNLDVEVADGDFIEIKWITPTWATNPGAIYCSATLWIDALPGGDTVVPIESLYGTAAYLYAETVGPIGGGPGYIDIYTTGSHIVTDAQDFVDYMVGGAHPATTGEVVFIPGNLELNLTPFVITTPLLVPIGVIVASDRGYEGSLGALLYHTSMTLRYITCLAANGNGVRVTGLRLRGPDGTIGNSSTAPFMTGFSCNGKQGVHIDNCEIYNWPFAGISNYTDLATSSAGVTDWAKAAHIHHNYIHHCRRAGQGYGIGYGKASQLVECNIFNACRHTVSGSRDNDSGATPAGDETYMEYRYNIVGWDTFESNGTLVDNHGGSDTVEGGYGPLPSMTGVKALWAGGRVWVHHNDFKIMTSCVSIRGFARFSWTVEWNWIYYGSEANPYGSIKQRLYTIPIIVGDTAGPHYSDAPPYLANTGEAITTDNNWWGTDTPPAV
jgi:hypothetical protein